MSKNKEYKESANEKRRKKEIIAVVGASADKSKWGFKIYKNAKSKGFNIFAVNPRHKLIGQDKCYPSLDKLPKKPDMIIAVVPPSVTSKIAEQCVKLGIKQIWMQPGSESQEAIALCQRNNIKVISNACFIIENN